jgi:serine/threonine-protein kinase RsbW
MERSPGSDPDRPAAAGYGEFPSSLEATASLLAWFSAQQPSGFDPLVWVQAQTALVEAFTNAVRHAHGAMAEPPPVRVEVTTRSGSGGYGRRMRLVIHDRGLPFDLEAAMQALESDSGDSGGATAAGDPALPAREAHWGLVMLARLRDRYGWQIDYRSAQEGGNQLVLLSPLA